MASDQSNPTGGGQPTTLQISRVSTIVAVLAVIGLVLGIWFVFFYNTAEAKCRRGDLGACFVYYEQWRQDPNRQCPSDTYMRDVLGCQ